MTEEASAFIVSARAGIGFVRSAGFQTCRIADFQVGTAWNSTAGLILTAIRRFGNPRYSRFGNLRYGFCTWKGLAIIAHRFNVGTMTTGSATPEATGPLFARFSLLDSPAKNR